MVRNVPKYRDAAMIEIKILKDLRKHFDEAAPFVVLLMCCVADLCLCVSWVRQHNMYKKYLKQEKKRKLEEAKAASKMGMAPTKMGRVGAIGKQPAERML